MDGACCPRALPNARTVQGSIAAFAAITSALIWWSVGLDLWLAFGVLAFFLNFIPNVGMFTSVVLPMPLVALDPQFTPLQIVLAFVGPLTVGMIAKARGRSPIACSRARPPEC